MTECLGSKRNIMISERKLGVDKGRHESKKGHENVESQAGGRIHELRCWIRDGS